MTYTDSFPPPPTEFYQAIKQAGRLGYWVKAGRRPMPGQHRFIVTAASSGVPLFGSDSIDDVRVWLRHAGAA